MGEEKKESLELGMSVIVDFALMYPEEVTAVCRTGDRDWRFRIGDNGPAFELRFDGFSQEYRLNNFFVKSKPGERLEKVLHRTYLSALNKDIATCSPKFADFRARVLGHFEVKPEREAEAYVEMGGEICPTAYTVSFYNGGYRIRRKATGEEILVTASFKEALKIARSLNAELYGFQRQQEGDAR